MICDRSFTRRVAATIVWVGVLVLAIKPAFGQVSPSEISNPKLKAEEEKYLPALNALHRAISETDFALPFLLSRYVTADPDRSNFNSNGLEFVYFQGQVVLKTSGIYKAAYDANSLTQNERAVKTFREVVVPTLRLITQKIPSDVDCDAIGFEIAYHARAPNKSFEYEGKEILVVVLSRDDAFSIVGDADDPHWQRILNRSGVFVNGKELGLALGAREPLDAEARERSAAAPEPARAPRAPSATLAPPAPSASANDTRLTNATAARPEPTANAAVAPPRDSTVPSASPVGRSEDPKPPATSADAERLQTAYQPRLDAIRKEGGAKLHLVDYAPPSFAAVHGRLVLQFTLRNPLSFEKGTSSIYKRAAQSFDLFLAPEIKSLINLLPPGADFDAFDFSVLNRIGATKDSSEAIEFICPLQAARAFIDDQITTQDLINQSIVIVNGVRISLSLQTVE